MGVIADIFTGNRAVRAQERAANRSIEASEAATRDSLALQREMFDRVWAGTQVGRDAGNAATMRLSQLSGLTPMDGGQSTTDWLRSTPGYEFNFNEGARALNTRLAGQGRLQSGDAQREAIQYGQNYGDRIFGQERNALQALAGIGQSATNTGAASAGNTAQLGSNALQQNARNLSSSYGAIGDAQTGFWGQMGGLFGSGGAAQMGGNFLRGFTGFGG